MAEALSVTTQDQLEELLGGGRRAEHSHVYIQSVALSNKRLGGLVEGFGVREMQLQDVRCDEILEISHQQIRKFIISQCSDVKQIVINCGGLTDLSVIGNKSLKSFWSQHKHLILNTLEIEMNPLLQSVENISTQLLFCQENDLIEFKQIQGIVVNQQLVETLIYQHTAGSLHQIDFLDIIKLSNLGNVRLTGVAVSDFEGLQHLERLEKIEFNGSRIHLKEVQAPHQDDKSALRQAVFRNSEINSIAFLLNPAFCNIRQIQFDFQGPVTHSPRPLLLVSQSLTKLVINGPAISNEYVAQLKRDAQLANRGLSLVVNQEAIDLTGGVPQAEYGANLWCLIDQLSQNELKVFLYRKMALTRVPARPAPKISGQDGDQAVKQLQEENEYLRTQLNQLQQQQSLAAYKQIFGEQQVASPNKSQGMVTPEPPRQSDVQATPMSRPLSGVRIRRNALAPMELGKK